jgi:hypothetical protein
VETVGTSHAGPLWANWLSAGSGWRDPLRSFRRWKTLGRWRWTTLAREIILYGLKRLARQDAGQAREAWLKLKDSERFTEEDIASIDREVALAAAAQSHPQALEWLADLGADAEHRVREWRVRCALRKQDWLAVLK